MKQNVSKATKVDEVAVQVQFRDSNRQSMNGAIIINCAHIDFKEISTKIWKRNSIILFKMITTQYNTTLFMQQSKSHVPTSKFNASSRPCIHHLIYQYEFIIIFKYHTLLYWFKIHEYLGRLVVGFFHPTRLDELNMIPN